MAHKRSADKNPDLYISCGKWRDVVAQRLDVSWQVYVVNHHPKHRSLSGVLVNEIGLSSSQANEWTSDSLWISLEQGKRIARVMEVELWWLLAMDLLQVEYREWATYNEGKRALEIDFGRRPGLNRFKEIIIAALNLKIPWRPEGHIYEPATCRQSLGQNN